MALISEDKLEEVRVRADIVEVIGAQVRLKRAGRNFVGLCPFHNEKTPSFSVNPERGFFHCFGCGAGGTVFNFVMRTEGLSFPEAIESLARRYGATRRRDRAQASATPRCAPIRLPLNFSPTCSGRRLTARWRATTWPRAVWRPKPRVRSWGGLGPSA